MKSPKPREELFLSAFEAGIYFTAADIAKRAAEKAVSPRSGSVGEIVRKLSVSREARASLLAADETLSNLVSQGLVEVAPDATCGDEVFAQPDRQPCFGYIFRLAEQQAATA
ncbi:MAG: hypothetical protein JWO35_554 [Candidatus Saccharibacteria bacterium]|nr:hypothetical protein [Candidatus Saccharibacteria bacterium]